jgi:RNA polymerase sigma factor (sigma-70 family)
MKPTTTTINAAFALAEARPVVRSLVHKLVKNRSLRDDAEQEANLRILRKLPNFDPAKARLTTFAFVVARSAVIDFLRREQRAGDILPAAEGELDEHVGREADPLDALLTAEGAGLKTDKRAKVARYLARHPMASKAEVCRAVGCNRDLVRKVRTAMERAGFKFPRRWSNQYRKAA